MRYELLFVVQNFQFVIVWCNNGPDGLTGASSIRASDSNLE